MNDKKKLIDFKYTDTDSFWILKRSNKIHTELPKTCSIYMLQTKRFWG